MSSLADIDRLNFLGNFCGSKPSYQLSKYCDSEIILESYPEINEEGNQFDEMKHAHFLRVIKKQINDLVYKDQEIGYNILQIGKGI